MGRKPRSRNLTILMNGEIVGEWLMTSSGVHEFVYAAAWLSSAVARPISLSMPLREERYNGEVVYSFFDNLLPDNELIRKRIRDRFGTGSTSAFQLLSEIGRDCVGAIQIIQDEAKCVDVRKIIAEPLNDNDIEELITRSITPSILGRYQEGADEFRISLAGAQEKTALLWHNGQWNKPLGATPTTHIFKLPLGQVGHSNIDMTTSVENEWLCSRILTAYGFPIARCEMAQYGQMKTLVVERFDRTFSTDGSWIVRLPQEDMCQATGTPPGLKYESDGGPGIRRIMNLLLGSSMFEADRIDFFRTQLAFWLLCAIDGHAKNFSVFIKGGGAYHLTPRYDVLSAYPVMGKSAGMLSPHKVKMAMAVWGKSRHYLWKDIQRAHFITTAADCGLSASVCTGIIDELIDRTPAVLDRVSNELPEEFPLYVADTIIQGVKQCAACLSVK
jgi:serine/threonine-protein kinase HipA